jgi:hypothetical protein
MKNLSLGMLSVLALLISNSAHACAGVGCEAAGVSTPVTATCTGFGCSEAGATHPVRPVCRGFGCNEQELMELNPAEAPASKEVTVLGKVFNNDGLTVNEPDAVTAKAQATTEAQQECGTDLVTQVTDWTIWLNHPVGNPDTYFVNVQATFRCWPETNN